MTISVIGSGYVGLTTALMFCELGYPVISVDKDPKRLTHYDKALFPFMSLV